MSNAVVHSASLMRELFDYDPDKGVIIWRDRFDSSGRLISRISGKQAGTPKKGYLQIVLTHGGVRKNYIAHRVAWAIVTGEWPSGFVDHVNGDPFDNRWVNLRLASSSQNNCNRHVVLGASKYRGVYFMKSRGKYAAQIKVKGVHHWLGLYDSELLAAMAYDSAALVLHGDFAVTNLSLGLRHA